MIVINMPGGGVEHVDGREILWFRKAFKSEWDGATLVRLSSDRIYSRESVDELTAKFLAAGVNLVQFTPPDYPILMPVNAETVREVKAAAPAIYGPNARSVLEFGAGTRLAVKEEQPAVARTMPGLDG